MTIPTCRGCRTRPFLRMLYRDPGFSSTSMQLQRGMKVNIHRGALMPRKDRRLRTLMDREIAQAVADVLMSYRARLAMVCGEPDPQPLSIQMFTHPSQATGSTKASATRLLSMPSETDVRCAPIKLFGNISTQRQLCPRFSAHRGSRWEASHIKPCRQPAHDPDVSSLARLSLEVVAKTNSGRQHPV